MIDEFAKSSTINETTSCHDGKAGNFASFPSTTWSLQSMKNQSRETFNEP